MAWASIILERTVKKYKSLGFKIYLSKNYGTHLGFDDSLFIEAGAKIISDQ